MPGTDVVSVVVESDEDVEVVRPWRRTYVQVKSRSDTLANGDVQDALDRFASYRQMHKNGERPGACEFVIATNAPLAPSLAARVTSGGWPSDVRVDFPGGAATSDVVVTLPLAGVPATVKACCELAERLPFGSLAPETLVWKLAGAVMAASSGALPRRDHAFHSSELTQLFELLLLQLQDFPAPPALYRPQEDEPPLHTGALVRLVTGFSGAGKTSWASQAALHSQLRTVYFDLRDVPGPGIANGLARELAARLYGSQGGLGSVLLPGASGLELLHSIGVRVLGSAEGATIVLDNAHSPPPSDVAAVIRAAGLPFVLLAHPGPAAQEIAARLGVTSESLRGWSRDTVAEAAVAAGCRADAGACDALLALTGGLPLYLQNAFLLAASENGGDVGRFSASLVALSHSAETAQELILTRVVQALPAATRRAVAVLSLCEVPLKRSELSEALAAYLKVPDAVVVAHFRALRSAGLLEQFGSDRIKIHDAIRLVGRGQFAALSLELLPAQLCIRNLLQRSVKSDWDHAKVKAFIRMLAETGEVKTLVELGGDELFHELGLWPEIEHRLKVAVASSDVDPETRFWALDGLVFNLIRVGAAEVRPRIDEMRSLVASHSLGPSERLALGMKEMTVFAREGRKEDLLRLMSSTASALQPNQSHQRIFRYNAAAALYLVGDVERAAKEALAIADEYFDVLGTSPGEVLGRNSPELRASLKDSEDLKDDCKHLADCLDLFARAANASGRDSGFARIHAMKFYNIAHSPESMLRVGQDLADEFIGRRDFKGARHIIEEHVLSVLSQLKLAAHLLPVRAQYSVVLAYCGEFDAAEAEMARLRPYEVALPERLRTEIEGQRQLIADLRRHGPPPQWFDSDAGSRRLPGSGASGGDVPKAGRNDPCRCGSGRKYSKCHGAAAG